MTTTFWMSFTDPQRPEGSQFLGVALVDASNIAEAMTISHTSGCNPGGEIAFVEIPEEDIPLDMAVAMKAAPRNTLMSRDELSERGLMG